MGHKSLLYSYKKNTNNMETSNETNYPSLNIRVIIGDNANGNPTLRITKIETKSQFPKPLVNYYFLSEEKRNEFLDSYLKSMELQQLKKAEQKKKKAEIQANLNQLHSFAVGDIFYDSWGWEQTNIDFYQITEVKGKTVCMRPIASEHEYRKGFSSMSGFVKPVKDSFTGEAITKRIMFLMGSDNTTQFYLKSRHGWISQYDGKPLYCSWYA